MATRAAPVLKRKPAVRATPVQAKLTVGPVGDRFEQEADRVAARVGSASSAMASPPPTISGLSVQRAPLPPLAGPEQEDEAVKAPEERAQRKASSAPKSKEDRPERRAQRKAAPATKKEPDRSAARAQRKAKAEPGKEEDRPEKKALAQGDRDAGAPIGAEGGTAPAAVDAAIQRMRKRPAPALDPTTRARVENAVGTRLDGVRVHTDSAAAEAANALRARAFTVGQDMFFGQGQFDPRTTQGQRLIAHEAAHTVQQRGGSAGAQRIQRANKKKSQIAPQPQKPAAKTVVDRIEDTKAKWAIDLTTDTVELPKLELPKVKGVLKGTDSTIAKAEQGRSLPVEKKPFTLDPVPKRPESAQKVFEYWTEKARKKFSPDLKKKIETLITTQKPAGAQLRYRGAPVYVLYSGGKKAEGAKTMFVGTIKGLSEHDSLVRPMLGPKGGHALLDADHSLDLQLGGEDSFENLALLDRDYNRKAGPAIQGRVKTSIQDTIDAAKADMAANNTKPSKNLPKNSLDTLRNWTILFHTVVATKPGTETMWTRDDIRQGVHLKYIKAMTAKELVKEGFVFEEGQHPDHINVFPDPTGGYAVRFEFSKDGHRLKKPDFFYRGYTVLKVTDLKLPTATEKNHDMATMTVRREKTKKQEGKPDIVEFADAPLTIKHDENLGFGGYVTNDSRYAAFAKGKVTFTPLCPIDFSDVQITADGDIVAVGNILPTLQLFPGLNIPIILRGPDILLRFPIPTESLNFGPLHVTDAALEMGVGANGFFIAGVAGIAVDQVGSGTLVARVEKDDVIIAGDFNLDLDFLDPAKVAVVYSLAKDDFDAKATLGVKKGALPGVESGQVEVSITRETFGLVGTLNLGGILAGSSITVGYTPEAGLLIEGKDLPLPVEKLPGVSDAKVTVRARRSPDTGEWSVSGGGKASLAAAGARGTLDIMFDGLAVDFTGRVDVAKGPASGWLQISATNRALDEEGKPIEGGPVGDLHIWGKGEATVAFGKVLTGKAGIEYTPDGRVIVVGEIAMPPTYDLFPRKDLAPKEPLFSVNPPDFPIWGVKVGPVGFGIFAFVDASIKLDAYVGPGQLRDAKVSATIDLDKPEEATVHGGAQFYVPAYAGLTLDVGGGVKAQVAVAYVKGRVGLYGTLGVLVEGSFDVGVDWNPADGFAVEAEAKVTAQPKFEIGVNASITAGVDLGLFDIDKTWGPWTKKLGEFGPQMQLGAAFPMKWSEKDGLDFDVDDIRIEKPRLDAKEIMKGAFDMLV
jgi:hypothetical protein